jgi:hypothetical protein
MSVTQQREILAALRSDVNCRGKSFASVHINRIPDGPTKQAWVVMDLTTFDDEGRTKRTWRFTPSLPVESMGFTYDFMSRIEADTLFNNEVTIGIRTYHFDANGRLASINRMNEANHTLLPLVSYAYDTFGALTSKKFHQNNALAEYETNYAYNVRDWLSTVDAGTSTASPYSESLYYNSLANGTVTDNFNGNISAATHDYPDKTAVTLNYAYDHINRLKNTIAVDAVVPPVVPNPPLPVPEMNEVFSYDKVGRLTTKQEGPTLSYDYHYYQHSSRLRNRGASADAARYIYGSHGAMVCDIQKKMVIDYDWRNQPVAFTFFSELPAVASYVADGIVTNTANFSRDIKQDAIDQGKTILSEVVMLYDAGGNRVTKIEK